MQGIAELVAVLGCFLFAPASWPVHLWLVVFIVALVVAWIVGAFVAAVADEVLPSRRHRREWWRDDAREWRGRER